MAVSLAWDAVPEATGYRIHWGEQSGQYHNEADTGNTTEFSLTLSGHYFFAVTAYNDAGESGPSNEVEWIGLARIDHLEVWRGTAVLFIDGRQLVTVERSDDLSTWEPVCTVDAPGVAVDPLAGPRRFYRLREE